MYLLLTWIQLPRILFNRQGLKSTDPLNQIGMWEEIFKNNGGFYTPNSLVIPTNEKPDSLVHFLFVICLWYVLSETNGCLFIFVQPDNGTEGTPQKLKLFFLSTWFSILEET